MSKTQAVIWVLGVLGSICAAAITLDKVLEIIHKYIKKAQEPDNMQNKRLDEMDKRIGTLEQVQFQHTQALARDLRRAGVPMQRLLTLENLTAVGKPEKLSSLFPTTDELRPTGGAILRGTGLGFLIGLIPGTNSAIPALLSYSLEKRLSKTPGKFGKGAIEGVAGPETANNSYCGGAMIPLLTLGIPSSPTIAILLGAFIMHGLTPGPILFQQNPTFVWGVIASMFVGNAMLLAMNLPLAGWWARIALVPAKLLYPIVLIISIIGAYTVSNDLWDVGVMLVFGVIGYVMKKIDIPMAPIVLTYVLGAMMEKALLQSVKMNNGSLIGLIESPISLFMLILAAIVFGSSVYAEVKNKKAAIASEVD